MKTFRAALVAMLAFLPSVVFGQGIAAPPQKAPTVPAAPLPKQSPASPVAPSPIQPPGTDIVTTTGKKYEHVEITRVEPDGLIVMTDSGISKIPFVQLPPDVQKKYGYDPQAAAAFSAGLAAAQRENFRREQASAAAAKQADTDSAAAKQAAAANPPVRIYGKVRSAKRDGLLVECNNLQAELGGYVPVDPKHPRPKVSNNGEFFLVDHPDQAKIVDGDSLDVDAVQTGTHNYGAGKVKEYKVIRVYPYR